MKCTWRYPTSSRASRSKSNLGSCSLSKVNCIIKCNWKRNSSSLCAPSCLKSFTKQGNHIWQEYWLQISTAKEYSHSLRVATEKKSFKFLRDSGILVSRSTNEWNRWKIRMPKLRSSCKTLLAGQYMRKDNK